MHEMPVIPQTQPMYSNAGPMPPYGMPYLPPGQPPQASMGAPVAFPHPSYLQAYNGFMPPSDPAMYAAGSAPPPPTPPIQTDPSVSHP